MEIVKKDYTKILSNLYMECYQDIINMVIEWGKPNEIISFEDELQLPQRQYYDGFGDSDTNDITAVRIQTDTNGRYVIQYNMKITEKIWLSDLLDLFPLDIFTLYEYLYKVLSKKSLIA